MRPLQGFISLSVYLYILSWGIIELFVIYYQHKHDYAIRIYTDEKYTLFTPFAWNTKVERKKWMIISRKLSRRLYSKVNVSKRLSFHPWELKKTQNILNCCKKLISNIRNRNPGIIFQISVIFYTIMVLYLIKIKYHCNYVYGGNCIFFVIYWRY